MNEQLHHKLISFFDKYPLVKYKAKEIIYHPEEKIDHIAFVKSGFVRIYNHDLSGKEITYSGFKPIFITSYFYAKRNIPNQYYIQALTNLEIWRVPINDFEKYLLINPQQLIDIIDNCLGSFHEVLLAWENSLSGDAYNRVAKLLLALSKNYGKESDKGVIINFHTTHQLIASMLGITRETASIQIKKLENNGYITQHTNTIIINDVENMSKKFD